jgi:acetylornithine deacetylase/succinyl-diaminopimelate desuccinylase-like protein
MQTDKVRIWMTLRFTLLIANLLCLTAYAAPGPVEVKALELLKHLVAYRSTAGSGEIKPMANYLRQQFLSGGFNSNDIHFIEVEPDTGALIVRYRGNGLGGKPVLLMAHMDVVNALLEDWTTPPFVLTEKDGYLYGRGTMDNKGGVAILSATFLRMKSEGYTPERDYILVITGDEETTANSLRTVAQDHLSLIDSEFALNSDAGGAQVDHEGKALTYSLQAAEKTYMSFRITHRNRGGHSSQPRTDNAIYDLVASLKKLQDYHFPVMVNDITLASFAASSRVHTGEMSKAMLAFVNNPTEATAEYFLDKPSLVGLTRTTCVATMLKAGHAENALPQTATAIINCRVFPGIGVEKMLSDLKSVIGDKNADIKVLDNPRSSPASKLNPVVMDTLARVLKQQFPGALLIPKMSSSATDAVETRAAGIPTYGVRGLTIGPNDHRSHGQDERISKSAFFSALDYWYLLLTGLSNR